MMVVFSLISMFQTFVPNKCFVLPRYMTLLKTETEKARKITNNSYFKFDEEDKVISFDKRKYLSDLPETRLKEICKQYNIKYQRKWVLWANISQTLKHPDIDKIIYG